MANGVPQSGSAWKARPRLAALGGKEPHSGWRVGTRGDVALGAQDQKRVRPLPHRLRVGSIRGGAEARRYTGGGGLTSVPTTWPRSAECRHRGANPGPRPWQADLRVEAGGGGAGGAGGRGGTGKVGEALRVAASARSTARFFPLCPSEIAPGCAIFHKAVDTPLIRL